MFFFIHTPTTEIYALSLHDALPIFGAIAGGIASALAGGAMSKLFGGGQKAASGGIQGEPLFRSDRKSGSAGMPRPISYAVFCLKKKKPISSRPWPRTNKKFTNLT